MLNIHLVQKAVQQDRLNPFFFRANAEHTVAALRHDAVLHQLGDDRRKGIETPRAFRIACRLSFSIGPEEKGIETYTFMSVPPCYAVQHWP
jgi:hypothetical protein